MPQNILYNYRRCPYAMRARMALTYAQIPFEIIEIELKNKPPKMLELSPKGTVPVLVINEKIVIDESLGIMTWALKQYDPDHWNCDDLSLIQENDSWFKAALDRYKYPARYPDEDCSQSQKLVLKFFEQLNEILSKQIYLSGPQIGMLDIAIFPFIRQAANTHREWFDALPLLPLKNWLYARLEMPLFKKIMDKKFVGFQI